jgi:hypothetical protein
MTTDDLEKVSVPGAKLDFENLSEGNGREA